MMTSLRFRVSAFRFLAPTLAAASLAVDVGTTQVATVSTATGSELTRVFSQQARCTAATADGRLWTLSYFDDGKANGDASRSLRIHESPDAGKTWKVATQVRTLGPIRGSIATGVDGETLHMVFEARAGLGYGSIYYADWNTRTKQWGAADKIIAKGANANSQFLIPCIDVARDGRLVVSHYTHRQGPWAGMLQIGTNGNWTTPTRVNADTYGVRIDHQIAGDDVWFAYRTNSGGYGIRARRYDLATDAWGTEGELQVSQANTNKAGPANNGNCVAIDGAGKTWVLWSCGTSTAGKGEIWLSGKAPTATSFNEHYKVDDDAPIKGGNNTYDHYSLAVDASGRVLVYYGLLSENLTKLWLRFPLQNGLSPKLTQHTGVADDMFRVNGLRLTDLRGGSYVLLEDRAGKSLRMFVRGAGLTVPHVQSCSGTGVAAPVLTTDRAPALGVPVTFQFSDLPSNAPGVFMLGIDNRNFGPFKLPLPLDALGFKGCLLAQNPLANGGLVANAQGQATVTFPYPSLTALTGVPVFWQGFVVAANANTGGGVLSNGVATIAQ